MNIKLHAAVDCTDGRVGHVTGVVLAPKTQTVTHLVVKAHGTEYIVPIALVETHEFDGVTLSCTKDTLFKQQPFIETEYLRSPVDETDFLPGYTMYARHTSLEMIPVETEHLPLGEVDIHVGMPVYSKNGSKVGHVDEVAYDAESSRFTHFLMAHRHLLAETGYVIGNWQIKSINEDGIYLKLDNEQVTTLPTMELKHHA